MITGLTLDWSGPSVIIILLSVSREAASYKDIPPLLDVVDCFLSFTYHVDSADGAQTGNVELGQDDCW